MRSPRLNDKYKASFYEMAEAGVPVVAKRTKWKRSKKMGKQWAATRGELFSYHLDDERYLRLTHTGESVVGFIHSPSGDHLTVLAVTHYEFGESGPSPIATAKVIVLDAKSFVQVGKSARLKKSSASLALYYGAGEELLLDAAGTVYSVDFEGGKLKKSRAKGIGDWSALAADGGRDMTVLYADSERARVVVPWGVAASGKNTITVGEKKTKIELPDSGGDTIRRISRSPNKAWVAFAGIGDPCKKDHQATIYVADTATGALKHVHRGGGLHGSHWLDDNRFIFEAEPGELRVYDAASKNTTHTIKNRSGISLRAVSNVSGGEHCATVATPPAPSENGATADPDGEPKPAPSDKARTP